MTIYLILLLLFCFLFIPTILYKLTDDDFAWVVGCVIGLVIMAFSLAIGHHNTAKEIGLSVVESKNIIIERGEFSCTFHIKNESGTVKQSIRIDKASELDAFKKEDYAIGYIQRSNLWLGQYKDDLATFVPTKVEK